MIEQVQNVLSAARVLYRVRHNYPSVPLAQIDDALRLLDEAVQALVDAEAAERVQAHPLSKMGG